MSEQTSDYVRGDWVSVTCQIDDTVQCHPEDVAVRLFSHNEEYVGHVRRDRVVPAERPGWASRCPALHLRDDGAYIRCEMYERHGDAHHAYKFFWSDDRTHGHIEEQ